MRTYHVRIGILACDPGVALLHYGEQANAELVAVGTRGQGFVARLLLGSAATKGVRASPLPAQFHLRPRQCPVTFLGVATA